jgi:phage host-nuclease inhibitor protein Gam
MARSTSPLALVPASLAEANTLLVRIGTLTRSIEDIKLTLEEDVAKARAAANDAAAPLEAELKRLTASVKAFATAHRSTILPKDKKSVVLPGGEIGWRLPPTRVTIARDGEEKVIGVIEGLGLTEYLRIETTLDREALLRDRPVIAGIKYTQKEQFFVKLVSSKEPGTFPGTPTKANVR